MLGATLGAGSQAQQILFAVQVRAVPLVKPLLAPLVAGDIVPSATTAAPATANCGVGSLNRSLTTTSVTDGSPRVMVPVLSSTIAVSWWACSSAACPAAEEDAVLRSLAHADHNRRRRGPSPWRRGRR